MLVSTPSGPFDRTLACETGENLKNATAATLLSLIGLLLLLAGLAGFLYPAYGEWRASLNAQAPQFQEEPMAATMALPSPTGTLLPTPSGTATPWQIDLSGPDATPPPIRTPTPSPTPTPRPTYGPAKYMTIPSIKLEAKVVEAPFQNGEYIVPLYDVGHHQGSPNPGEIGNSIYVGHVATISAGHVFARLAEIKPGDAIYVFTEAYRTDWVVYESKAHDKNDVAFLAQGQGQEITLYTCYGTWDWVAKDYDQRWVVKAKLGKVEPRSTSGS